MNPLKRDDRSEEERTKSEGKYTGEIRCLWRPPPRQHRHHDRSCAHAKKEQALQAIRREETLNPRGVSRHRQRDPIAHLQDAHVEDGLIAGSVEATGGDILLELLVPSGGIKAEKPTAERGQIAARESFWTAFSISLTVLMSEGYRWRIPPPAEIAWRAVRYRSFATACTLASFFQRR